MQAGLFHEIHLFHRLGTALDLVGIAVLKAAFQKLLIQSFHGIHSGHWHQKIIPGIAHQILHQTLLVAAGYITEVGGKHIMGRKHPVIVLCNSMEAETFFDTDFAVVKDEPSGNTAEMVKHSLLGFQKALCILVQAGHDEDVTAAAEPSTEDLDGFPLSTQINGGLAPVDLNGIAGVIFQGHIRLGRNVLFFHFVDYTAHNGVGAGKVHFRDQTVIDPLGGVRLLPQPLLLVRFQTHPNEVFDLRSNHTRSTQIFLPDSRHDGSLTVFLYRRPGYTQSFCD